MKIPKKTKFKKYRKNNIKSIAYRGSNLQYGSFGLKALTNARITAQQIETIRQTIQRGIKPKGKLWIRIFPQTPVTSKPAEVRMGKGKGNVKYWVSHVKRGQILFEISGIPKGLAHKVLKTAGNKLPMLVANLHCTGTGSVTELGNGAGVC